MKTRKVCCTILLVLTLSVPAFAGWIHAGATATPTPTPDSEQALTEETNSTATPHDEPASEGALTEVALRLAQTLLALF